MEGGVDVNQLRRLSNTQSCLDPRTVGPTLPPLPPITFPTGPTGITGSTGMT
ncbi:exosporium leader peptide-containing protein, partial [Bacillus mobilis]|uniref:exosporium leader peptide-containing protein n=1 Tax=Bacillus mobilis TaxID=2026190 RepID=UPI003A4D884D